MTAKTKREEESTVGVVRLLGVGGRGGVVGVGCMIGVIGVGVVMVCALGSVGVIVVGIVGV